MKILFYAYLLSFYEEMDGPCAYMLQYAIVFCGLMACVSAWFCGCSFGQMGIVYCVGMAFIALVSVPDWAFFRRSPSLWLTPFPMADKNNIIANTHEILNSKKLS